LLLTPLEAGIGGGGGFAFAWFYGYHNQSNQGSNMDTIFFYHSGGTAGFTMFARFQPKSQTGVVGLSNCGNTRDIVAVGAALASNLFQN
jgi:CubicO group peptidase (beta-lactamase class C family)